MKIYFDYSTMLRWRGNPTGIPRTVFCLANAMRALRPDIEFVALDDELGQFHVLKGSVGHFSVGAVADFSDGDLLFSAGAGWAFACYNEQVRSVKAKGVRVYQVFYDLIPALFPFFYEQGVGFGDYFGSWCTEAYSLCDGAFAISACTKGDMATVFGLDPDRASRIRVIRLGEDFCLPSPDVPEVTRFGSGGDFVLSVGTLEIRKNQTCLLNAYRLLVRRGADLPRLILAGKPGWLDGDIAFQVKNDRQLRSLVEVVTDADDHELQWLYENCRFSLFPALYEGWGLPVAESLKAGRPCISSDVSSMLEIAPELTLFASPYSSEEWADAISTLLLNDGALDKLTKRVRQDYVPTAWSSTATEILEELTK